VKLQGSRIGVAVQERIDISGNRFKFVFTIDPNFCSSSTINNPRSLKQHFIDQLMRSITISFPSANNF
jgi:hypothetical protein